MILIRAVGAFAILFCLAVFISANSRELTGFGSGYNYLLFALAAFAILFLINGDIFNLFRIKLSTLSFLVFIVYFGAKYYLETNDYEQTKQFLIGTSNGIIFSIFIGFMCAYALTVIYEMRRIAVLNHLAFGLVIAYLAYVLYLTIGTFQYHMVAQQNDLFLIEDQKGLYQRVGDFLLMQIILLSSLLILILSTAGRFRFFSCLPIFLLLVLLTALTGLTAQLVGSNSGLIGPVSFITVVSILYIVLSFEGPSTSRRSIKISSLVFGGMSLKLVIGAIISVGILTGVGMLVLHASGVDVDTLRVTGYGSGENSSVVSRNDIFVRNFIPHFAYNPVFGHTQVETLAGDRTTYVHSLASILTHLGLVGFFLFLAMMLFLYKEITTTRQAAFDSLFSNQQYGLYRLFAIISLLAMCSVSQFFTWMPMWFAFGMFGEWIYRTNRIRNTEFAHRPKRRRRVKSQGLQI